MVSVVFSTITVATAWVPSEIRTRENSAVSKAPAARPKKIGSDSSVFAAIER